MLIFSIIQNLLVYSILIDAVQTSRQRSQSSISYHNGLFSKSMLSIYGKLKPKATTSVRKIANPDTPAVNTVTNVTNKRKIVIESASTGGSSKGSDEKTLYHLKKVHDDKYIYDMDTTDINRIKHTKEQWKRIAELQITNDDIKDLISAAETEGRDVKMHLKTDIFHSQSPPRKEYDANRVLDALKGNTNSRFIVLMAFASSLPAATYIGFATADDENRRNNALDFIKRHRPDLHAFLPRVEQQ